MKKTFLLSVALFLCIASAAGAVPITITFDETYVNPGAINDRQDGTQISTQYKAPYGVTWADIYPGTDKPTYTGQVVCMPGEFNGPGYGNDNYLFIYGNNWQAGGGAQTATVTLDMPSNYFSIEYRRPQASGTFEFALYMGNTLVSDSGTLNWIPGNGWVTYTKSSVIFDKVIITENDKSSFDNFTINPVPIPPSILLLVGGLGSLGIIRRRLIKH
jgi:hypothetical protein